MTLQKEKMFSNQQLIRLVIPLIIETGLSVLVGMCDGVMVSSVGEAAISGVSLVDMINGVVLMLFAALSTGGAVVTSQFLGAKEMEKARQSVGQLVIMSAAFGVAATVLCLVLAEDMLMLFFGSIAPDVMAAALTYFRITALAFPFIALYNAGAAIFRSVGNSKISMKVSILMNLVNVTGNALCIFVLKMGVSGVAIPTLISRVVGAAVILYAAGRKDMALPVRRENLRSIRWGMMRNILRIGIPSAMENSLFQLGRVVVVSMIAVFGTYQTSANAVANTLDGMGVIIGQAFSLAMVTVIGRCVGAQDEKQTVYYIKKLVGWDYVLQGLSNALILAFLGPLVGLYSSLSPETVTLTKQLVWIHAGTGILLWPVAFVLPNALRAANDVRFTMVVSIFSMLFWRVGFSWVLCVQLEWGALGVWAAMVLDWIFRTILFVGRTASGKWKTKYIPEDQKLAHSGRDS